MQLHAFIENKKYTQAIWLNYISIRLFFQFTNRFINNPLSNLNLILGF